MPAARSGPTLNPFARVGFACESLKVTTRVMHIVAWLLTQRAIKSGEIEYPRGRRPERRLGNAQDSDPVVVEQLPDGARRLIRASADLYARVSGSTKAASSRRRCCKSGAGPDGSAGARPERRAGF